MKKISFLILLYSSLTLSQGSIKAIPQAGFTVPKAQWLELDTHKNLLWSYGETLFKKEGSKEFSYSNLTLGTISSVDAFNPLKIIVLYKEFNTVVLLDNKLSELRVLDFNRLQPYRQVSLTASGPDNALWIYNQDQQQLELYDYKQQKVRATTLPVQGKPLDLSSNYNVVWLLTDQYLYGFNYFGRQLARLPHPGFQKMALFNKNLLLQKDNQLYYLPQNTSDFMSIELPELLINHFFLTNQSLYIYADEKLHQFQLKIR